ncbi:tetratricopeptide repeat protein [Polaribacter sp. Z022]|uniref:tetratricopeptide repeat protein n=1 Tax=Polaribacter sp. Z022 TaxID=2927125 RepID=UPI0020219F2B|nr:tetratricopeptide repeat protein [Polaribacter sp. Z022]MCL7752630.1 tetratricopeptide repeat protein [Polaribacter sp. Z022]
MFGSLSSQENIILEEKKLEHYSQDSTQELKLLYNSLIKKADTLGAIITLQEIALTYSHLGSHKDSYDNLWLALLLADASNNDDRKALIYRDIGRHYSYYKRKEKALQFLNQSLSLRKKLVALKKLDKEELANAYLAFVATFRELKDLKSAKKYLDSSAIYLKKSPNHRDKAFYSFENGVILNSQGKYKESLKEFTTSSKWFDEKVPGYKVLINTYIGDCYKNLKEYSKSESYYLNAIETSNKYKAHKNYTPLIYERLSALYLIIGEKDKAFKSLKMAKDLDALYFDSRSKNNRPLLEIQDEFLEEKKRQIIALKEQRINQLEQEEKVDFLERMLLLGFIVFLVLFSAFFINSIRSKHKAEKEILRKKRELELQKNLEIIELKNKELAASVIKLIEKDAFIEQLKNKLSKGDGEINRSEAKQILNSISVNSLENWNEFETKFVSINKKFYTKLNKKFPNLTHNDQRLCALVKLNFSSKEIAKLLNMSNESVHTTRSRLRKKLNLSRDVNLKQFIASI